MKKEQFNRVLWNVRSSVLLCIAFLFVTGAFTAWAEQKEATIAIPYLDTVISEPVMLVDANDSILPASLPIAIAKFTKTVTLASQSVVVVYDTGDPLGTMALKDPANPPFPRGKNATLADLLVNIHQEGDGFVYDGAPVQLVEGSANFNFNLMHPKDGNGSEMIAYYSLYSSRNPYTTEFQHELITSTYDPTDFSSNLISLRQRKEWSETNIVSLVSGTKYYRNTFDALEGIDDDFVDPELTTPYNYNTTTYWIAIETKDKVSDGSGKTLIQGADTRYVFDLNVMYQHYFNYVPVAKDARSYSMTLRPVPKMVMDAEVVDVTPFASYTSKYWTSLDPMSGMVPSREGYPAELWEVYLNSQLKYNTVNGLEFYEATGNQLNDLIEMMTVMPDTKNPELMPLNEPYPVLGLNVAGRRGSEDGEPEVLSAVSLQINVPDGSSFDPNRDLANDLQAKYPGISIWYDVDGNGRFDKDIDEQLDVVLSAMMGEIVSPVWEDEGSGVYTVTLSIDNTQNLKYLDRKADGRPDFFLCLTAKPNVNQDLEQPRYGSSFTMEVKDVHYYYKDNCLDQDGAKIVEEFDQYAFPMSFFGMFLGYSYDPYGTDYPAIFACKSKEVKIALDVKPYNNPDNIEADGFPVAMLAFNMVAGTDVNETLHSIKVRFDTSTGFNPKKLADLSDNHTSGVSLWKDNKDGTENFVGVFDPKFGTNVNEFAATMAANNGDTCVTLANTSLKWYIGNDATGVDRQWDGNETPGAGEYFYVLLTPKKAIELYPNDYFYDYDDSAALDTDTPPAYGKYRGMDYFICIRGGGDGRDYSDGNRGLDFADIISVSVVPGYDFEFGYGPNAVYNPNDAKPNKQTLTEIGQTTKATMPVFFSEPDNNHRLTAANYTAVLGVDIVAPNDGAEYSFNHFAFQVIDEKNANGEYTFAFTDYVDSGMTGADSGIALYKDDGDGVFDESRDTRVKFALNGSVESKPHLSTQLQRDNAKLYLIEMDLDAASVGALPSDNAGLNAGADYFLVMKPTRNADPGDTFKVQVWGSDLLGTGDDTIAFLKGSASTNPLITFKRFQSGKSYSVATVSNDVYQNLLAKGTVIEPATLSELTDGTDISKEAIGIRVFDPLNEATLNKIRIYFDSDNAYNPEWLLNPIADSATDGIQLWDANGRISVTPTEWKSDAIDGMVKFNAIDGWTAPETLPNTTLKKFETSAKLVWFDKDNNGVWSDGDALWIANTITDVNKSKFSAANDTLLAGDPLEGALGTLVSTNTFGFTWIDGDDDGAFDPANDFVFYTGSARTALGYYLDLELAKPVTLPTASTDDPAFTVKVRANDNPSIFGFMRFRLSLLANGITYSTGYSSASSNLTTELVSFKSTPAAISNFKVKADNGKFLLTWNVAEDDNHNVVIIRRELDALAATDSEAVTGYPVNQTFYIGDASIDGQIFEYETTGTPGTPDEGFEQDADKFYKLTDTLSDVKVVYVGKGDVVDDTTRSFKDGQVSQNGKFYYYMAFQADVTNTLLQGTPNSAIGSSRSSSANVALRDQMLEAEPWGIQATLSIIRPEPVTGLTLESLDQALGLTWTNPTLYTDGTALVPEDCSIIILRREGGDIESGLLLDGNAYPVGTILGSGSDVEVVAILDATTTSFTDPGLTDATKHYYYDVYAYYKGNPEDPSEYNYSETPAKADGSPLDLGGLTAYPTSIATLLGTYNVENESTTLTWTWGDATTPNLLIVRSKNAIADVYPENGKVYAAGDTLAEGIEVLALYTGSETSYTDATANRAASSVYYYAVYSYNPTAGIYNPTNVTIPELTGKAALEDGVNMCAVSTASGEIPEELVGYIYDPTGDQKLNDSDDDGITDFNELGGDPASYPDDPYSPYIPRSLDLATGEYAYAQVTGFNPPRTKAQMIEFWLYIAETNTNDCTILRSAQTEAGLVDEFTVQISNNDSLVYSFLSTATNLTKSARFTLPDSEQFEAQKWYHIAIQISEVTSLKTKVRWVVYKLDDTPVDYSPVETYVAGQRDLTEKSTNLILGEANSSAPNRLKMHLDELRFWSAIQPDSVIADNRLTTVAKETANLAAYYRFDDGGYTAEDYLKSFAGYSSLDQVPAENLAAAAKLLGQDGGAVGKALFSRVVPSMNGNETDSDNDGLPDWWEMEYFGNLTTAGFDASGSYTDFDKDGLNDFYEYLAGTDPTMPDTDGNGIKDPKEDSDGDNLTNLEEQKWGTHPGVGDSDDDGINDKAEIDAKTSPTHSMSPAIARSFKPAVLNGTDLQTKGLTVPLTTDERNAGLPSWTVEAWVNPGASTVNGVLFKRMINGMIGFEVGLQDNKLYVKTDCQDESTVTKTYPAAIPASTWTHVAVVWNPGTLQMSLVINGISQVVFDYQSEPVNFWTDWTDDDTGILFDKEGLGAYVPHKTYSLSLFQNTAAWPDDFRVDEVRIWSAALDIKDIFATHNTLVGKKEASTYGLMRCYRFDDGGVTIEDFAHPMRENLAKYVITIGIDNWCDESEAAPMYGMDDADGDGMPDWFEFFYRVSSASADDDGDGLINLYEYLCGTDPTDTTTGTDDFDAMSADGKLTNGEKQFFGLDPRLDDSDGDGLSDYDEINGTADTFPKGAELEDTAADPLNPLNNLRPDKNPLKHFEFTGSADGLVLTSDTKYAQESWTVMAWVKTDNISQDSSLIKRQTSEKGVSYDLALVGGIPTIRFAQKSGATVQAPATPAVATKLALVAGEWTHLAGSFDAATGVLRLYLNGMPVAETVETKKRAEFYGDGVIGGELVGAQVSLGQGFTGSMDAVQFYDSALEGDVISDIYHVMESGFMGVASPYYAEDEEVENGVDTINMTMSVEELLSHDYVENQLLVKFNSNVSEEMIEKAHAILGTKTLRRFPVTGTYLIEVPKGLDIKTGIEKLRQMNAIEFVEPNYKAEIQATPNDPDFSKLWGLKNSSNAGVDVGATDAWNISKGSKKVIVAVIDSGIDYTHPDLAANMWVNEGEIPGNEIDDDNNGYVDDYYGYDFGEGDSDPAPNGSDHGTHVAGTIGAVGNNAIGVVGVNWDVKLMALKCGVGERSIVNTTEAYEYAIAMGANVMNCSFGGGGYSATALRALAAAQKKGILVVCAAGNEASDNDVYPVYPAGYELDNIISVASMDSNGKPSSFTNYGKTSVDIAAPGGDIYSTLPNSEYGEMSGTSMAAPHVAGMAAWLKAVYPKATYKMLREALLDGVVTNSNWGGKIAKGGYTTMPRANAVLAKSSGGHQSAAGLIACFRGNAVFGTKALDLTEIELGASADGQYEAAPQVGRYAAELGSTAAADTIRDDYANFNGDSDGDGMPDWYEVQVSLDPTKADGDVDSDMDGLTNYFEYLAGTSPWNAMTDGTTLDKELTLAFGDLTYEDAQRLGVHPKAETADYEDYDTDDDSITDKDESGYGDKTKTGRADDSLIPSNNLVLKLAGTPGSYLSLPNQARYLLSGSWSLDLWVKIAPELTGDAVLIKRTIDTKAAGNANDILVNYELGLKANGGLWMPYVTFTVKDGNKKVVRTCTAYNGIAPDIWTHVGAIFRGADAETEDDEEEASSAALEIYINNALSNSIDCSGITMNGEAVGISEVRVGEGFLGMLDAVRIWNVAKDDFSNLKSAAEDAISDYVPYGLAASFIFDDGGKTAQNFAVAQDDWKEGWLNAAKLIAVEDGEIEMIEETAGTSPVEGEDKDSDGDGLPDWWELYYGLDPYDASGDNGADGDPDGDELSNYDEYLSWYTDQPLDPKNPRTYSPDKDGELDSDGDGLSNAMELKYGTDPGNADTDDDGLDDYVETFGDFSNVEEPGAYYTLGYLGARDPLSPLVWRALYGAGTARDTLVIPEEDRILGHDANDGLSQDWTIEAWFLPTGDNQTGSILRRAGVDATGEEQYYFDLGLQDGMPYVRATMKNEWQVDKNTFTNILEVHAKNGIAARKNVWTHYAATWNSTTNVLTLYINGIFAGSSLCMVQGLVNGGASAVGFTTEIFGEYEGSYLEGYVDDVRVWTDTTEGRKGLRYEKQIREFMAKAPKVKVDDDNMNDYTTLPTAYYRFDDSGKFAEDFAYSVNEEMNNEWPHALKTADGSANADLNDRMLSTWNEDHTDAEKKDGSKWYETNAGERAICMNGNGNSELDPIPNGWMQIYWPDAKKKFGVEPGEGYDFNQNFALTNSLGSRTPQDDPKAYPGENSSFVNTVTGELQSNEITHYPGTIDDAYVYFTDLYFDNLTPINTVNLTWYLGMTPGGDPSPNGVNEIFIFVNGHRVGFSANSTGLPGEDVHNFLTSQIYGQKPYGGYGYHEISGSAAISGTLNIAKYMVKGRNRIAIYTNHTDDLTDNGHPQPYRFYARVRVNGEVPDNKYENWPTHVRWFWSEQESWYYAGNPGSHSANSEDSSTWNWTTNAKIWDVMPYIETPAVSHTLNEDGTPRPLLWFEHYYATYPWSYDQDPDGDGLTNWTEYLANTNPLDKDVNGDGRLDSEMDIDNDGLPNSVEQAIGTMPNLADTDDDGQDDYYEANNGTDPLNGAKTFQRQNLVLNLNGKYILNVPEVGDNEMLAREQLESWTLQAWVKLDELPAAGEKGIIVRRARGQYAIGDFTNYELGITDEGLPYAGFSNVSVDGKTKSDIFATMKTLNSYEPFEIGKWYHVSAVFNAPDDKAQGGYIALYVFDEDGNMTSYVRNNVALKPMPTVTGHGGITIGGKLPEEGETMDGDTKLKDAFVGKIDNLAIWNRSFTEAEIKANYSELASLVSDTKTFHFYYLKAIEPSYRVNDELVHAFLFDDGGKTVEDMAVKNDWYNGHAHAISAPLIPGYAVYDVVPDETQPLTDAQGNAIYDADGNQVYADKAAEGVVFNILGTDEDREDTDTKDTDNDGLPDSWELTYWDSITEQDDTGDPDEDGLINIYEYYAGLNPTKKETNIGENDAAADTDGDGLTNFEEQMYGSHPNDKDTDDDGVSDKEETELGRDPLNADGEDNYYVALPEKGYLQYPAEDFELAGNLTLSMEVRLDKADIGKSFVIASREADISGNQFKLEMEGGIPKFTVGKSVVKANKAIKPGKGEYVWFKLVAKRVGDKLTLEVDELWDDDDYQEKEIYENDYSATGLFYSSKDIFLGDKSNDVAFGIDEFQLVANYNISSKFDDLGRTFENSATTKKLALISGKPFIDQAVSAAKAYLDGTEVTDLTYGDGDGTGTKDQPWVHVWFTRNDKNGESSADGDSDGDGLPDEWELDNFGNLDYGAEDDPDGDGLVNIYEYWAGTDPLNDETAGDCDGDPDNDGLTNYEEQLFQTRPDMWDTDDDGYSDGLELGFENAIDNAHPIYEEVSSAIDSLEQPLLDEDGIAAGLATADAISKLFRMDGSNTMTVTDNAGHSGRAMSFSFWMRANMKNAEGTGFDEDAALPAADTVFLKRTVNTEAANGINYQFTVSKKSIKFQFAQKAKTQRFTSVAYTPADGIKPNAWYFVSAVADLDAATPAITISVSAPDADGNYIATEKTQNVSAQNTDTIAGDEGELILGHETADLVLDVDDLSIWNYALPIVNLDGTSEDYAAPAPADASHGQAYSLFRFDDGGETAEDFGYPSDWLFNWKHAGVLNIPTVPFEKDVTIGLGMVHVPEDIDTEADSDNDGLPDGWEYDNFGDLEQGAEDDPDEDGLTNLYEYLTGRDPNEAESKETDTDGDGLSDIEEQQYGTHPADADTDDDGVTDRIECEVGRNPLKFEILSNYYAEIPAGQTLSYPAKGIALEGEVSISAKFGLPSDAVSGFTGVLVSRKADVTGNQFKLEMANGKPKFTLGATSVAMTKGINAGADDMTWFRLDVQITSNKITMTVYDDEEQIIDTREAGFYATIADSTQDIVVGDTANGVAFGIDALDLAKGTTSVITTTVDDKTETTTLYTKTYLLFSSFNDLGATFENSSTTEYKTLVSGRSFIDQEKSAGVASSGEVTGDGTVSNPWKHEWFKLVDGQGENGWTGMEVAIETLSGEEKAAFNPANDSYDLLSGSVTTDASQSVDYAFFWISPAVANPVYVDGELTSLDEDVNILCNNGELDLADYADRLAAGDTVQLVVVALDKETGEFIDLATASIELDSTVEFNEETLSKPSGATTAWSGDTVTLTTSNSNANVELYWYCNGLLYGTDKQTARGTKVSFKMPSGASVKGDAWSYHAWILDEDGNRVSRMFPELGQEDYTLIGSPWTGTPITSIDDDPDDAYSTPPSMPTKVTITPENPYYSELLVATATGTSSQYHWFYEYQWYLNGQPILGANMPYYQPVAETDADQEVSVGVKAVNIFGAQSPERRSLPVTIRSSNMQGGSIIRAYEPNDTKTDATFIAPKGNFYDLSDPNIQEHYLYSQTDVDWFYFVVPNDMTGKKKVIFETNAGAMWKYALGTADGGLDNALLLYNENGKLLATVDDYTERVGNTSYETKYARFEKDLEPGVYYVRIALGNRGGDYSVAGAYYQAHLGIFDISTTQGPTAPTSVVLTPAEPGSSDTLVCTAEGAYSSSGEEIRGEGSNGSEGYYYVWYRNGELICFGNTTTIEMWTTSLYEYLQAKNYSSSRTEPANEMPAEYTKRGDLWYCVVYAKDKYGLSQSTMSNIVEITDGNAQEVDWSMQLIGVSYKGGNVVNSQNMRFGWNEKATNGYDSACDIKAPGDNFGGANSSAIIGYDNTARRLVKDIRPYGKASAWFVEMEFNDSDTSGALTWNNYTMLPDTTVASGLTVTRVAADKNGTYQPVGASVDMSTASSITVTEQEIERLPRNARGYRTAVFRIALGQPDTAQTIALKAGWNLVSFPMKPIEISGIKWDTGAHSQWKTVNDADVEIYEYSDGSYVTPKGVKALKPCTGYWIYVPEDTTITVFGPIETESIKLSLGWNLIGVPHDISNFKATYSKLWTPTNQIVDPDSIQTYTDGGYKLIGMDGSYSMTVTKAYWVYSNAAKDAEGKDVELDMTIAPATSAQAVVEDTTTDEGDDGGGE